MTASSKRKATGRVFQIKVSLRDIRPPIWRRILVDGETNLHALHGILQEVMGWADCHLYAFEVGGKQYIDPETLEDPFGDWADARSITLAGCRRKKNTRFRYMYDFGDGWEHDLLIEDVLPADPSTSHPICVKGRRACPPEDCGGPWGYAGVLDAVRAPEDPSNADLVEWLPDEFDPEAFDLELINARLRAASFG